MTITGTVIAGESEGIELGSPTANLHYELAKGIEEGVWAAWVMVHGEKRPAAVIVGVPFRSDPSRKKLEVHLLDWNEDLYGETLSVTLVQKISEICIYDHRDELIKKIQQDIEIIREVLGLAHAPFLGSS